MPVQDLILVFNGACPIYGIKIEQIGEKVSKGIRIV